MQRTISPIDGKVCVERPQASAPEIAAAVAAAEAARPAWRRVPIAEKQEQLRAFVGEVLKRKDAVAEELTRQMGRPIRYSPKELDGFADRARHMIDIAPRALADIQLEEKAGFTRFIRREPLGTVFVIAPWNYPFLCSVNSVVPALMAGSPVLLKLSSQTPLVAERYSEAAAAAGLPKGVLQHLHLGHEDVSRLIQDPAVGYVAFTGSVEGGRSVHRAAAERFIAAGLELGGKDPAYVRPDADLDLAVETLVDGAYFNSGQSCCGIERIYAHRDVYDRFIDGFVALTKKYVLDDPLKPEVTLGPMVRASAAKFVRGQVRDALAAGAKALIDEKTFPRSEEGTAYLAPQVLTGVDHSMAVMSEETFGPVVGIMPVDSDEEAVRLMNDSRYGLTAAIFTRDQDKAVEIGDQVETGTWFMNRCDYLDPALAWTGVKDSGRGCTLSAVGYEHLTRPKSFHLKRA
ncbi:MAG: aldehyde dehydrogenase family protein [Elusimicrobiota bacterium]